jgi:hypothetical protein
VFPPGEPGGGMTGMRPSDVVGGLIAMPGSILVFGGTTVPRPFDNLSLKVVLPEGAIFSGGGDGAFCGATVTVGFSGPVGWGFCACAAGTAKIKAEQNKRRFMIRPLFAFRRNSAGFILTRAPTVRSAFKDGWYDRDAAPAWAL